MLDLKLLKKVGAK
jgi:ribonuclease HI